MSRSYKDDVWGHQMSEVRLQLGGISRLPPVPTPYVCLFDLFLPTISRKSFCSIKASAQ